MAVFCFPVSAAQQYPQKTSSASGDVSAYCTIEFRGFATDEFSLNFWDNRNANGAYYESAELYAPVRFHVSVTLRNRSSKIQVADLNNFRLSVSGFNVASSFSSSLFFDFYGITFLDASGVDVYDVSYNNSSNTAMAWSVDFRDRNSLVLEPDEQRDYSFDIYIPAYYRNQSPTPLPSVGLSATTFNSSTWGITQVPTFTAYTIEEYANVQEGWWSYLVRSLQRIVNGNQGPYEEVEDGANDLADSATDSSSVLNDIHAQEEQWYNANSSAIEATGLSNYHWSTGQALGLNAVVGQFSQVWSALGDWTLVYTFTLILSLATFILRHRPSTKMQQRMKLRDAATESQIIKNQAATDYYSFKFNDAIDQRNERLAKSSLADNVSGQSLIDIAIRRRNRK